MALIITNPTGEGYNLDAQQRYFLYGGNDCLGTRQCWDVLYPQLVGDDLTLYRAAFAFQAPCLAMTLRGARIDEPQRRLLTAACEREETAAVAALNANPQLQEMWDVLGKRPDSKCAKHPSGKLHQWLPRGAEPRDQFCKHCGGPRLVGTEFNPHSSTQCAHLLYDLLGLKRRWSKQRDAAGRRHLTTDDEALEAIALHDPEVAGLIDLILVARGLRKQLGVLRARLDPDGRWRATFNVCAASTGRMSSSKSPYRSGGNMQNVADKNRGMFTADPGLQLFYADMEAAESTLVAWDAECPQDIKDHENGDAHTGLAQTIFPDLDWGAAGGDPKLLRAIAEQRPPWGSDGSQVSSYRQVAKVTRHGTNIGMSAVGIARQLHSSRKLGAEMRERYFARYPENLARQLEIRGRVRDSGVLVGPLGNTRRFLGRLWEDDIQREALAQTQQSTVAWMLGLAVWRIWYELDTRLNIASTPRPSDPNRVWLLGPIHDAVVGLVRPDDDAALARVKEIMECPIVVHRKLLRIRCEIQVGPNWGHAALKKWLGPRAAERIKQEGTIQ